MRLDRLKSLDHREGDQCAAKNRLSLNLADHQRRDPCRIFARAISLTNQTGPTAFAATPVV